jgi:Ca2+/Na+ antiporter
MRLDFSVLGYWNYFFFMLMALIIAAIAYTISHIVDALDRRTRFSGVVVAGTIVALVSSLPEFTSSLVSLFSNSKIGPSEAACNLMGGNLFRTIMFAAVLICFITQIKKLKTTKTIVISVVTQIIIFALYIVFTIG